MNECPVTTISLRIPGDINTHLTARQLPVLSRASVIKRPITLCTHAIYRAFVLVSGKGRAASYPQHHHQTDPSNRLTVSDQNLMTVSKYFKIFQLTEMEVEN